MAYNKIFADLPTDLHPIICKYNRKAIYVLPKDRLMTYKWKYLIKAVFGISYDLPVDEMMMVYDSLSKSKNIYSGYSHTIIRLTDGILMACGNNDNGQLGLGDTKNRSVFKEIKGIPKNVVDVACGKLYTIIRLSDGTLMACGFNGYGQLGLGDTKDRWIFEEIKRIPKNVVDVMCGGYYTILRFSNGCSDYKSEQSINGEQCSLFIGTLMACGHNDYGQLGLSDTEDRSVFEEIKGIPKNVVGVSCGFSHTIIRLSNGTLMACGNNSYGQLGLGDTNSRSVFEEIKGIPKNVVGIVCGGMYTIIRLSDVTLIACGNNYFGQLGFGDTEDRLIFEKIKNIPKNVVDVSCGYYHTIIRLSDGTLMTCGINYYGQLGLGDTKNRLIFEKIKGIPKNVVDINCGSFHTIIRLSDGTLMACGHNYSGQLGFSNTKIRLVFEVIKDILKNVVDVSCGYSHTIIRLSDGTLMICGFNNYGQLGFGDMKSRSVFEEIKGIPKNVVNIACCENNTIIRLSDGTLMACGSNNYGQLGFGDTEDRFLFEEIKNIPKN